MNDALSGNERACNPLPSPEMKGTQPSILLSDLASQLRSPQYRVTFALSRVDGPTFIPQTPHIHDFVNDSEIRVSSRDEGANNYHGLSLITASKTTIVGLTNTKGRLGAIIIDVPKALSARSAYEAASAVLDDLRIDFELAHGAYVRSDAALVANLESGCATIFHVAGNFDANLSSAEPVKLPPSLKRIVLAFADGVVSSSAYYRLLRLYGVVEVMTTIVQRAFLHLAQEVGVTTQPLNGFLRNVDDADLVQFENLRYTRLLRHYRPLRIRVAHIISEYGSMPEPLELDRPCRILRIVTHELMQTMLANTLALRAAGVSDEAIDARILRSGRHASGSQD